MRDHDVQLRQVFDDPVVRRVEGVVLDHDQVEPGLGRDSDPSVRHQPHGESVTLGNPIGLLFHGAGVGVHEYLGQRRLRRGIGPVGRVRHQN